MGIHYVVRMKHNWLPVKKFMKSRKQDIVVTMEVPDGDYERYRQLYPEMKKTVKCRLVRVRDEQGNLQILCTSLMDSAKFKLEDLANLYKLRWGVEEGYKMYKARVQVEAFSGKTATAVSLIAMFIKNKIEAALSVFDKQVEMNTEVHRPGRTSPRKKKPPRLYHMNYKDL
jgi:Transposase DDE domain